MKRNSADAGRISSEVASRDAERTAVDTPMIGPMGSAYWYASLVESLDLVRWRPAPEATMQEIATDAEVAEDAPSLAIG